GSLQQDRAAVQLFIDEMNSASGELHPVLEGLVLSIKAGESRQERRMDIEQAVGEFRNEMAAEDAHVAGQANQVDFLFQQQSGYLLVELRASHSRRTKTAVREAQ